MGPATQSPMVLKRLFMAGASVARFNMSHGTHEEHAKLMNAVRQIGEELKLPIAILLDTKGPEVRVGAFKGGKVEVSEDDKYTFTTDQCIGTNKIAYADYPELYKDMKRGTVIMVADGLLEFVVDEVVGHEVKCTCVKGGTISDHKAMNFPGMVLSMPYISEIDRSDLIFACEQEVDFIAASFVSNAANVLEVKDLLSKHNGSKIDIIAKIENQDGVANVEEILDVCNGIMIARGDLGVEIPFVELPGIQKRLIATAHEKCRRVIVATEMLESMIQRPRPTRAEVSDVANAVYEGATAIMLSGETAAGRHPVKCVETMAAIAVDAENQQNYTERMRRLTWKIRDISDAMAHAAATAASDLEAKALIVFTKTGTTARMVSRFRPEIPVIGAAQNYRGYRKLALAWGVIPVLSLEAKKADDLALLANFIARGHGCVDGDTVVITTGWPIKENTNTVRAFKLGQ